TLCEIPRAPGKPSRPEKGQPGERRTRSRPIVKDALDAPKQAHRGAGQRARNGDSAPEPGAVTEPAHRQKRQGNDKELPQGDPEEKQARHEEDMVGAFRDDVAEAESQVEG